MEDLSLGSVLSKKLRELGFHTIESLATATARELRPLDISKEKALEIIYKARSCMPLPFIRADELLTAHKNALHLTTGSRMLDQLLGGGLETQTITEFYGEYGTGKSQICHQLCVNAQLSTNKGGLNGAALYIDTENTFRTKRIVQMASHLDLDMNDVIRNIFLAKAYNSDHQMSVVENADKMIEKNNIHLIIVDSLTSHFRSEYLGREMLVKRQQKLNKHLHKLNRLARVFNTVVVVTNQVMSKPDAFFGDGVHPVGGHVIAHASQTRVYIRKSVRGPIRIARLVSSPHLPEGEGIFKITRNGIEDITN